MGGVESKKSCHYEPLRVVPQSYRLAPHPLTSEQEMIWKHWHSMPFAGAGEDMAFGAVGDVYRRGQLGDFYDGQSVLGRIDAQQLGATVMSALPNIGGDTVEMVAAQAYRDEAYGVIDPLPIGAMVRYNRFKTEDLRGDPATPAMTGTFGSAGVNVAVRGAATDEFYTRRMADSVAPLPSIGWEGHRGNCTFSGPTSDYGGFCTY